MDDAKRMLTGVRGGTYIPPHRLRMLLAQSSSQNDPSSQEYQRIHWEALRKNINGLINKVNTSNIRDITVALFRLNILRGRGIFARSIMNAQLASLPLTPVFAALVAIINTKLPQIGELLVSRLIDQFRKAFKRKNKPLIIASLTFLAHLVNHQVAHELVALQIALLLLERPTDDSIEVAVAFLKDVGAFISESAPQALNGILDRFRFILHESLIEKRTQYMIEVLFQVRRDNFKDNQAIPPELDLVPDDDIITHDVLLDSDIDVQKILDVFQFDPEYETHEHEYSQIRNEILGSDSENESDDDGDAASSSNEESDDNDSAHPDKPITIQDRTGTEQVNLRRKIYLTLMSSLDFEETVHKLLKLQLKESQSTQLTNMIVESCAQERTFSKFYALIGDRLCRLRNIWSQAFHESFNHYYSTIHRFEKRQIRNMASFFGFILAHGALPWSVLHAVRMSEPATTASSRIFIKILFEQAVAEITLNGVVSALSDPQWQPALENIFPTDNVADMRFSINVFTVMGLGPLTEHMRECLTSYLEAPHSDEDENSELSESSELTEESDQEEPKQILPPTSWQRRPQDDKKLLFAESSHLEKRPRPAADMSPPRRPSADMSPPRRPSADMSPPRRPAADMSPPRRPAADMSPPRRPSADMSPPRKPAGDISPPIRTIPGDMSPPIRTNPGDMSPPIRTIPGDMSPPSRRVLHSMKDAPRRTFEYNELPSEDNPAKRHKTHSETAA